MVGVCVVWWLDAVYGISAGVVFDRELEIVLSFIGRYVLVGSHSHVPARLRYFTGSQF